MRGVPGRLDGGTPIFLCAHLDTVPPAGRARASRHRRGIVRNAAGTILGADNKSAVVGDRRGRSADRLERTAACRRRAVVYGEEGGRPPRGRARSTTRSSKPSWLRLRPGGADRQRDPGCAVRAVARRHASTGGRRTSGMSRRRAGTQSPPPRERSPTPARPGRRGDDRERRRDRRRRRARTSSPSGASSRRGAFARRGEVAELVQEMLDSFAFAPRRASARSRSRSRDLPGLSVQADRRSSARRRRAPSCGYEPRYVSAAAPPMRTSSTSGPAVPEPRERDDGHPHARRADRRRRSRGDGRGDARAGRCRSRLGAGTVTAIVERHDGARPARGRRVACVAYPRLTGPVEVGDDVLVNVQARELELGTRRLRRPLREPDSRPRARAASRAPT